MQNMIRLAKGDVTYNVYFDINRETRDYENVIVRHNKFVIPVIGEELEQLKDTIALELHLSNLELATIYHNGHKPTLM